MRKLAANCILNQATRLIICIPILLTTHIVTRDELMTDLWDNKEYVSDNTLTVNISRLRNKLNELGYKDSIVTRKGQGYLLL